MGLTSKLKSRLIRYAFALLAAGMGILLRIAIVHFTGPSLPTYITCYPFIMFAAMFGGLGPGLLATAVSSIIIGHWFLSLPLNNLADVTGITLFLSMGILMSGVAEFYQRRNKKQEDTLRQAGVYNRSLFEFLPDPIVTISKEGKIADANKAAVKIRDISKEKLIGTDFSSYFTEPEKAQQIYQEVFNKGSISDYPLTVRSKDGRLTDVLYNATVYKDERGNVLGVLASARDVTVLNFLEEKLVRSEKLAIIGKLASSVAHELRNPLGVIKNAVYYLNMLEPVINSPKIKENLDVINREIDNSDKVITNLLEFSRAKEPVFHPENINLIVREALDRSRIPANIELVLELGDDLPKIKADAFQMSQVFSNITKNALEAMRKGGTLRIKTEFKHNTFVEVTISDTGPGIPKENIDRIFEPLFSTKAKGTGLGLTVCLEIVERHNGRIEVDSDIGKGAAFRVQLPRSV